MSVVAYQIGLKNDNNLVFSTFKEAFKKYPEAKPLVHSDCGYQYTSPNFKLMLDRQGFYMKRLQRRFKNQTPSKVRNQALTSDNPEYYPIPINLSIEKYWKSLEAKKTVI